MTEQEINIKIAEFMGHEPRLEYEIRGKDEGIYISFESLNEARCWMAEHKMNFPEHASKESLHIGIYKKYNRYCNDLNEVWEVEEKMKDNNLINKYDKELAKIIYSKIREGKGEYGYELYLARHATAKECCEAVVKVLEEREG